MDHIYAMLNLASAVVRETIQLSEVFIAKDWVI